MKTKTIVIASLLSAIAALFQLMPIFFSKVFIFLTIFSAIPIYLISRINPKAGILSYFVTYMIIMSLSVHEALFFLCTNGIVGLSLGICSFYTKNKVFIWTLSSLSLSITLVIMNFVIGIPILGFKIPGMMIFQISIIYLISLSYIIAYYYFSSFIYRIFKKRLGGY